MRTRLATTLDRVALFFFAVTLAIDVSGGTVLTLYGTRLSARSPSRALLATILVLAVRLMIDRRSPPPQWMQWLWRRIYRSEADHVPSLPREGLWARRALALLAIVVFSGVMLQAQLRHMDSVPDLGDPLFSIWRLGWVFHQMQGDPRGLFDGNIYYPAPMTLVYSDSMLLPALLQAPLLAAGLHPVVAYNTAVVASFVASAFACYFLVEALTASIGAGFIAALLFAFHPFHFEHYIHFELLMAWWIPLSLLALHRFVATGQWRWAVAAGLLATAQLYSSMYLAGFYAWMAALVFVLTCALTCPGWRRLLPRAAVAAALAFALTIPLLQTYRAAHLADRPWVEVGWYSTELPDYLHAHPSLAFWTNRTLSHGRPERALFPGAVILVLAGAALVPPLGAIRIVYGGALLLLFELTRGYNGFLYPLLYEWLPVMRGMRVPARASLLVGLALSVLAGVTVRRLLAGRSRAMSFGMLTVLTVAIGVDLRPALGLERVWPTPPQIYKTLNGKPDAVLAEFPFGQSLGALITDTPHMYFSLWHWRPLINGYSGHSPEGTWEFQQAMRAFPDATTIAMLQARGATHVTINCALYREGCEALMARADRTPGLHAIASERWHAKPVKLYELTKSP